MSHAVDPGVEPAEARFPRWEYVGLTALVGVLLYLGLAPFVWSRANDARWAEGRPALIFSGEGMAVSSRQIDVVSPGQRDASVELWVIPSLTSRDATLLTLSDDDAEPSLSLSTRGRSLTLRYLVTPDGTESRALSVSPAFEPGEPLYVAITSTAHGTRVYLNGTSPDKLRTRDPLVAEGEGLRSRILIGNSALGSGGWEGEVLGLAIYSRALSEVEVSEHAELPRQRVPRSLASEAELRALYAFDMGRGRRIENLVAPRGTIDVPRRIQALRWDVLTGPPALSLLRRVSFQRDIGLNLLGFIPLGLWVARLSRRGGRRSSLRRFLGACAAGALVSLVIELGQVLLPGRYSSLLDLLLNTLGSALGALFLLWLERRVPANEVRSEA